MPTGINKNTELLIKETARVLFQKKGFAATKTRDIAKAADINLALVNYYFRSKKKLYDLIIMESIQSFFSGLLLIVNDESSSLKEKLYGVVESYIDTLSANPDMAIFVMNELNHDPDEFIKKIGVVDKIKNSVFIKQFLQAKSEGLIPNINPLHFMMNMSSLIIFPFIARPLLSSISSYSKEEIVTIIKERKSLIPLWIESMLEVE